uniref:Uncharacterized protein n=1 Tax=Romanomermis culicivorax TaxID=13658 RepID=A0A915JNP9_ROMCU
MNRSQVLSFILATLLVIKFTESYVLKEADENQDVAVHNLVKRDWDWNRNNNYNNDQYRREQERREQERLYVCFWRTMFDLSINFRSIVYPAVHRFSAEILFTANAPRRIPIFASIGSFCFRHCKIMASGLDVACAIISIALLNLLEAAQSTGNVTLLDDCKDNGNTGCFNVEDMIDTVFYNISKSPSDIDRSYIGLKLKNGMQILLISEPNSTMSAATLSVLTGYQNSPREYMGMAHFVEHMLFQGTEKYPDVNHFASFIRQNGGDKNAYTNDDRTFYYFDLPSDKFIDGLDIWAQFFISPLFEKSTVDNEMIAVQSEFDMASGMDMNRHSMILNNLVDDSQFIPFGLGNFETLAEAASENNSSLNEEAKKFFREHYSANLMSLVVLTPYSFEKMIQVVVPMFSQVKNKNLTLASWPSAFYNAPKFVAKEIRMESVQNLQALILNFPLPVDLVEHRHKLCSEYIFRLLKDTKEGSFNDRMKKIGLIDYVYTTQFDIRGSSMFRIAYELTDLGFENTTEVVKLFFAYIEALKKKMDMKWLNDEIKAIKRNKFLLLAKESPLETVQRIINNLVNGATLEDAVDDDLMINEAFDQAFHSKILSYINPENMNMAILGEDMGDLEREEKYFGTKYTIKNISKALLNELQQQNPINEDDINFTKENQYVPHNLQILDNPIRNQSRQQPEVIFTDSKIRVWYSKDTSFHGPQTFCAIVIRSKMPGTNLDDHAAFQLFKSILYEKIDDQLTDAKEAGYNIDVKIDNHNALSLTVKGYSEKIDKVAVALAEACSNIQLNDESFLNKKHYHLDTLDYEPTVVTQYYEYFLKDFLLKNNKPAEQIKNSTINLELSNLLGFLSKYFANMQIETFIHTGDLDEEASVDIARKFYEVIERKWNSSPLGANDFNPNQSAFLKTMLVNINDSKEWQARYGVKCKSSSLLDINHFTILIIGPHNPAYVESKIDALVEKLPQNLINMTESSFDEMKNSLKNKYMEEKASLFDRGGEFWTEIEGPAKLFDRKKLLVDEIGSISKEDLILFVEKNMQAQKAKLSLHFLMEEKD